MQTLQVLLPWISSLLVLASSLMYIVAMIQGVSEPTKATWGLWFIITNLICFAMWQGGQINWTNFQIVTVTILNIPVLAFVYIYGVPKFGRIRSMPDFIVEWRRAGWTKWDKRAAILVGAAIILWKYWNDPFWGLVLSLSANVVATAPTWIRNWDNPGQEKWYAWAIVTTSSTLQLVAIVASLNWSWSDAAQSIVFCSQHVSMLFLTLVYPWWLHRRDAWEHAKGR